MATENASSSSSASIDVFEVFKIGSVQAEELRKLPLEELRKRYTILAPILSEEQLQQCQALATVPLPGHTVVDANAYKEALAKQARDIAAKQSTELMKRTELTIERIKRHFAEEFATIHSTLMKEVAQQRNQTMDLLRTLLNDTESSTEDKIAKLNSALVSQEQQLIEIIQKLVQVEDVSEADPETQASSDVSTNQ